MESNTIVLFVNHLEHACGVYQFFKRMTAPVVASNPNYYYIETNHEWEHDYWLNQLNPAIIVYNFYFSGATMPWLTNQKIASQKSKYRQMCLFHEGNVDDKGFDLILHQDPTNTDRRYFNLSRPIPEYTPRDNKNLIPTIGTFGFGLGGKGFTRVVETVIKEFEYASIRMNIPYAHFGDAQGHGARAWAEACYKLVQDKPLIDLSISHTLLPQEQLLEFLAGNDINCFFYDANIGRGISGTLDYALAVKKPIAITRSDQFRHIWSIDDRMLIENHSLLELINNGAQYLQKFHDMWNTPRLIYDFEQAFKLIMKG